MFAVILLPNLRLQAAMRFREDLRKQPVALVDERDPQAGVLELNARAAKAGIVIGQTSTQALARCPGAVIIFRSLAQEQAVSASLLELASGISPEVEATAENFCIINLKSWREKRWLELGDHAVSSLKTLGLRGQVGIAPNPDLAFLAAKKAQPVCVVENAEAFLSELSIRELQPDQELLGILQDWGIHTLAQFTALSRSELLNRLGQNAANLWDRAAGKTERPLRPMRAPEEFFESFNFEREIETVEPLLFMLRRFVDHLAARLNNALRVAGRMTFSLTLSKGADYERSFTIPSPTANADTLFRIVETHLDGLRLEQSAVEMRLHIEPTLAERAQFQLFGASLRDPNRFGETLARLAAIVGSENVGVAEMGNTYRPDCFRLVAPRFQHLSASKGEDEKLATGLPLRRWRPTLSAAVQLVQDRPAFIASAKIRGAICDALGPHRASGNWWDAGRWANEEWDIELAEGGLYRLSLRAGEWRIEGSYDEPAGSAPAPAANVVPMRFPKS